ncbi:hypothetical protein FB45DRAFT_702687, partial [Roridomyces roridus]
YWSLDPTGTEGLTPEEAKQMGFPNFELDIKIRGFYWADDLYAGMWEFYTSKGYDPETLDVARDLGYPLCEISCEKEELHAYCKFRFTNADVS